MTYKMHVISTPYTQNHIASFMAWVRLWIWDLWICFIEYFSQFYFTTIFHFSVIVVATSSWPDQSCRLAYVSSTLWLLPKRNLSDTGFCQNRTILCSAPHEKKMKVSVSSYGPLYGWQFLLIYSGREEDFISQYCTCRADLSLSWFGQQLKTLSFFHTNLYRKANFNSAIYDFPRSALSHNTSMHLWEATVNGEANQTVMTHCSQLST